MRTANFETHTQTRTSQKQTQIELINFLVLSMRCLFDFIEEKAEQKKNTVVTRTLAKRRTKAGRVKIGEQWKTVSHSNIAAAAAVVIVVIATVIDNDDDG